MPDTEMFLIVADRRDVLNFTMNSLAIEAKSNTLAKSALIAKVTDADSKILAVRAQQDLKRVLNEIEKARKALKEPLLAAGRQLDTLCAAESVELEKEFGRVSLVVKEFDDAERRRVLEEERLQRLELERIEREKQAEIERIAREQREREETARKAQQEAERKAREAREAAERKEREEREAAEKLAREATNKKQREAAEKARLEAEERARLAKIEADKIEAAAKVERERQEAILAEQRKAAEAEAAAIEERAGDSAYAASRPVEITRVAGQRTVFDVEITKINDWALARSRPDLVRKIEFDMRLVKEILKRGEKLVGVESREIYKADVRVGKERAAINI
jgi:hypothetical protein